MAKMFPWHAITASEIAPVRDGDAEVAHRALQCINHGQTVHDAGCERPIVRVLRKQHAQPTMARKWVKRWDPAPPGQPGSLLPAMTVHPPAGLKRMNWTLPVSKSHAIRWVALAAQVDAEMTLNGMSTAGEDVVAMRRCLMQCGIQFTDLDAEGRPLPSNENADFIPHERTESWRVRGRVPETWRPPGTVLHAGNSGTTLRILMGLASRWAVPVMVDGDANLRRRSFEVMLGVLEQAGVAVSNGAGPEHLPALIQGPFRADAVVLDATASSQPITAMLIASAGRSNPLTVRLEGEAVSTRHAALTVELCRWFGAQIDHDERSISVHPWTPEPASLEVDVVSDASMMAFPLLAAVSTGAEVNLLNPPAMVDSLGHEVLLDAAPSLGLSMSNGCWTWSPDNAEPCDVDLRDGNDLITPLAAMLALSAGGVVRGAAHAANKESNRLTRTVDLLAQFGLESRVTPDGLDIPGGQALQQPVGPVDTWGDHRMHMTALVLSMGLSEDILILGDALHSVADPDAVERWQQVGANVKAVLHQPW